MIVLKKNIEKSQYFNLKFKRKQEMMEIVFNEGFLLKIPI